MALGRKKEERQQEFWVAMQDLAQTPRHAFYEHLNRLLAEADFDRRVEDLCEAYYAQGGRPSIPPGVFFRMIFVGYFENISSQRGIAWRCDDSRDDARLRWPSYLYVHWLAPSDEPGVDRRDHE